VDVYDEEETADDSAILGLTDDSIDELQTRTTPRRPTLLEDDIDTGNDDGFTEFEIVEERMTIDIVPQQADEFTCDTCFLVLHRTRIATNSQRTCIDCAN